MTDRDRYILDNYRKVPARVIAKTLAMPKGSVITRYSILSGKRRGQKYTREDGSVVVYNHTRRPRVVEVLPPVYLTCNAYCCSRVFKKRRFGQLYCDPICRERNHKHWHGKRRRARAKANGSKATTV